MYSWELNADLAEYLNEHINEHLSMEEVESITIPKPCPKNVQVTRESDTYITSKLEKFESLKSREKSYEGIQDRIAAALGPLTKLWSLFYENTDDGPVDLDEVLEHISQTVILMGQSINYTLYQRRWNALSAYYHDKKAIKKVLDNYQDDFAKENKFLFGEKFQRHVINRERTSQKVETALAKTGR